MFTAENQRYGKISYTEFIKELDRGNIRSVTISDLQVQGEFFEEANVLTPDGKDTVKVNKFETLLPSFQGEDLLLKLEKTGDY